VPPYWPGLGARPDVGGLYPCEGVLFLLGFTVLIAAIYQNAFTAPIVDDQREYGQVLVDTYL